MVPKESLESYPEGSMSRAGYKIWVRCCWTKRAEKVNNHLGLHGLLSDLQRLESGKNLCQGCF